MSTPTPITSTRDYSRSAKKQTDYYLLAYSPTESPDGSCHALKVKVDKGGATVRARSSYCNMKAQDLLAGKPVEQDLEYKLTGNRSRQSDRVHAGALLLRRGRHVAPECRHGHSVELHSVR